MRFRSTKIGRAQSLGERLKRTRHRKKISLVKMESLTKIRLRYLTAIERGEYEKLPGDVYIKGFLRGIARVLHADGERLIALYRAEINQKGVNKFNLANIRGIREIRFALTPRLIFAILGVFVIAAFGSYIWYQVSGFAAAPRLTLSKPTSENLTTRSEEIALEGNTDPGNKLTINDQPIAIGVDGQFSETISLKTGLNQINLSVSNKIGKEVTKTLAVLVKSSETQAKVLGQKNQSTGASNLNPLVLIINIGPNSSWVSVDIDDKNIFEGVMVASTSREFVAEGEIILTSGNAGSVRVYLNSHDLGILGKDGQFRENIKFNLDTLKLIKKAPMR